MTYSRIGVGAGRRVASVVDHHDLEIPDRLAERGVDRFLEEYRAVSGRHDHREARCSRHVDLCPQLPFRSRCLSGF